jgi:hypothetical protein
MFRARDLRFIVPILGFSAFLMTLAGPLPVAAQDAAAAAAQDAAPAAEVPKIPNSKCLNCHDDAELTNDAGKSMAVHEDAFKAGAHKRVECVECHVTAGTVKHPRNALGPVSFDVCMDCHEDEITPFKGSVHARIKGGEPKSCEGCHGNIHTTVRSNDPNAPMSPLNQVRNCGVCHEEMMDGYLSSVHAKSLFVSGLIEAAPSCADCHGTHDILRHTDPKARSSHQRSPEMCGDCHKGILKEWDESAHGVLWREGKDGPVCSTCHQAHAIESTESAAMRLHVPSDCGDCHADLYKSFHDSFHGKASAVGHGTAAMCSDCHTPHHNLPASDPRSSTHPDNLAATCGASSCHEGQVNASFLTFIPHSNPMDDHRDLPDAGGDRPAAEVQLRAVGADGGQPVRRRREHHAAAPPGGDRHLRLLRMAPRHPGAALLHQEGERAVLGPELDDAAAEGRQGHRRDVQVLPLPRPAAGRRPLDLLGEVRLPGGVLGHADHRRLRPDALVPELLHQRCRCRAGR